MPKKYTKGLWSEYACLWILRLQGYRFIAQRFRTPFGEMDLILCKGKTLVVVEVKYRQTQEQALWALRPQQQARLQKAVQFYLTRHPRYASYEIRVDLMTFSPWCWPYYQKNVCIG